MPMQGEAIEFDEHARTQEIHMISSHTNRQTYAKTQNQAYSGQPSTSFEPIPSPIRRSRPETRVVCGVGGHATRIGAHDGDMLS